MDITLCLGERDQRSHVFFGVHLGGVVRPQQRQFWGLIEQQWKRLSVGDVPVKDIVFVHRHGLQRAFDGMGGKVMPSRVQQQTTPVPPLIPTKKRTTTSVLQEG